jgi:hypothetical protein
MTGVTKKSDAQLKADIVPFLYALGNNTSITYLDISNHQMGNKGAIALSRALQQNQSLASVLYDGNLTGLLGFINLKNALKLNFSLKQFPLPVYDIGAIPKSENENDLQLVLHKIEKRILRNQQQS